MSAVTTSAPTATASRPEIAREPRSTGLAALSALSLALVLAVWAVMTFWCWVFVERYGSPIAYADDLELASAIAPESQMTWGFYWQQANEHRIAIPRFVYLALLGVTRDFRSGMFFQVVVLSGLALGLVFAARRLRGGVSTIADAFFPLALLHWGNCENLLLGMQITIVVPVALVMLFLLLAIRRAGPPSSLEALGMITCVLLLPLNGGFGLMQVPPLVVFCVVAGVAQVRKRTWSERRAGAILLGGSLAAALLVWAYFIGFYFPPKTDRVFEPLLVLWTAVQFLSLNLGPIGQIHPVVVPLAALVVPLAACWFLWTGWRQGGPERWRIGAFATVLAAALTIAAAIGVARSSAGPGAGLACRYVILPAAWYLTAYLALCRFGPRWIAHALQLAPAIAIACCLSWYERYGSWYGNARLEDSNKLQRSVLEGRELNAIVAEHWATAYTSPEGYRSRLLLLRAAGYPPFRGSFGSESIPDVWVFECTPTPLRVTSPEPARARRMLDLNALNVRADAEIVLPAVAGATTLEATFGMLPNAWKGRLTGGERSDGLKFSVELRPPGAPARVLWERELHPKENPGDRGAQWMQIDVPPDAAGEVVLLTRNVSGKNQQYDWAFWGRVALR